MNCELCDRRTLYYGRDTPCPDCVTRVKSASSSNSKSKSAYITIHEHMYGPIEQEVEQREPIKSASKPLFPKEENEKPYWITLMEIYDW